MSDNGTVLTATPSRSDNRLRVYGVLYALVGVPGGHMLARAGYARRLSVLARIPLVNIILVWWFAFAKWKTGGGAAS